MSTVTREEFASAVNSAISSIRHLYREVGHLMNALREDLAGEPEPLSYFGGSFSKAGRDQSLLIVRNEYVALFGPPLDRDEEEEEEEEESEFDEEPEEAEVESRRTKNRRRMPAEIMADQPLLAVRIVMFDPQRPEAHEPQIQFAVMSGWTIGREPWKPERKFVLQRYMLRRVPRALGMDANLAPNHRLVTKAVVRSVVGAKKVDDRHLACGLPLGAAAVPLHSLDTAEELGRLAQRMKSMYEDAVKQS